ncbi:mismatch repair endonuclease PMS2 [Lycorma delicatula]|uniref:mismatch repair endonuclease PMS2 n=1 Tax=Lycorma delicatula TaxID=130591 RepID=UPI003F512344
MELAMQDNLYIKPISKGVVHRICSGQVVLNLAIAVKELVENSLDSGATAIDVRLKDYGSELVEVSDNGSGVYADNFQFLTLKHHTSKLEDFSDLLSVETFGFRGEALSSLCALSEVSIITRHSSSQCGTHLIFDANGIITSAKQIARQVGTTVSLKNIFSTVPVRQKEFQRNLKREFAKMIHLLNAYCLVATDVKITCTNQSKKEKRSTIVSTQSCKTVRENIACVYGAKQLTNLLEWKHVPSEDNKSLFRLDGIISSCSHGNGRSTTDRQFFYINSRPCEPSKVIKVVNEVYHQYNLHQSPFVFLNIKVPRDSVDVNVTPDKRQIFLDQEKILLDIIKESLQKLYEYIPSTFSMNNISSSLIKKICNEGATKQIKNMFTDEKLKENAKQNSLFTTISDKSVLDDSVAENVNTNMQKDKNIIIQKNSEIRREICTSLIENDVTVEEFSGIVNERNPTNEKEIDKEITDRNETEQETVLEAPLKQSSTDSKSSDLITFNMWKHNECTKRSSNELSEPGKKAKQMKIDNNLQLFQEKTKINELKDIDAQKYRERLHELFSLKFSSKNENVDKEEEIDCISEFEKCIPNDTNLITDDLNHEPAICKKEKEKMSSYNKSKMLDDKTSISYNTTEASQNFNENDDCKYSSVTDSSCGKYSETKTIQKSKLINVTLNDIQKLQKEWVNQQNQSNVASIRFRALIDPSKNKQAEQELTREISKDMFSQMEVIGQFNLGFIIARLKSDLFIIDQHATDEKYNFETLQRTTIINNQRLVMPQKLELTAINESVLLENIDIFKANGFEFQIDNEAPPTQRVSLTAIPMSKTWTFGKEDIDELLFMLQDSPHTLCRPSRVRAMFASRACRKSVMIGTALTQSKMETLLTHMGEIEQPWNCPHGRPTMRHLVNLDICQ